MQEKLHLVVNEGVWKILPMKVRWLRLEGRSGEERASGRGECLKQSDNREKRQALKWAAPHERGDSGDQQEAVWRGRRCALGLDGAFNSPP